MPGFPYLKFYLLPTWILLHCGISLAHPIQSSSLQFIQNKGQWPGQVAFKAQAGPHSIWLENGRITYQLMNPGSHPLAQLHAERFKETIDTSKYISHSYRASFVGAGKITPIPNGAPNKTTYNYYQGSNPSLWKQAVPSFNELTYNELYPGIDLRMHGGDNFLKYDFDLKAGNNGKSIAILFEGVNGLELKNGKLRIKTALGVVEEHIPKAYQWVQGHSKEVQCQYSLVGNTVGFIFPKELDPRYPTVIDPLLNFLTYSGASSDNWGNTAVSDKNGDSYTAGIVFGSSFPTTLGAIGRS